MFNTMIDNLSAKRPLSASVGRVWLMRKASILTLAVAAAIGAVGNASAGILYSVAASVYSENFDSLPTTTNPNNGIAIQFNGSAHIQNGNAPFPGGWKDDSTTDATYLSLPGWYLWSDIATLTTATGGANAHVQFRYGGGNAASGTGFFAFSSTTPNDPEKALGIRSASVFTNSNAGRRSYVGLQLINNTTETLHSFTITYDGEQYSEGASNLPPFGADGFDLQWSLVASAAGWHDNPTNGGFYNNGVSGVDYGGVTNSFVSPINNITTATTPVTAAVPLNGNLAENGVADITHTISGIDWAPGTQLWIRWRDGDAHDGIAIDNVRFTASTEIPEPSTFLLLASALLCCSCRRR